LFYIGYSSSEARISLRSSNNNIDNAITHILERRQQKQTARKAYKEQQEFKKFLGKDTKDVHIKTDLLSSLIEMGFRKQLAVLALSKADNNISEAV
jgi:putative Ca2+/H+ antiporter (TMEM165/GDT1 family)